jgi:homocysteine S-methyltransferase
MAARVVVLDGGFGTELEATGEDLNHQLWSARILGDPVKEQLFKKVHLQYLQAGAQIVSCFGGISRGF